MPELEGICTKEKKEGTNMNKIVKAIHSNGDITKVNVLKNISLGTQKQVRHDCFYLLLHIKRYVKQR